MGKIEDLDSVRKTKIRYKKFEAKLKADLLKKFHDPESGKFKHAGSKGQEKHFIRKLHKISKTAGAGKLGKTAEGYSHLKGKGHDIGQDKSFIHRLHKATKTAIKPSLLKKSGKRGGVLGLYYAIKSKLGK